MSDEERRVVSGLTQFDNWVDHQKRLDDCTHPDDRVVEESYYDQGRLKTRKRCGRCQDAVK